MVPTVYLLRHEERHSDISFDSPLTPRGHNRAATTIREQLATLPIDHVYSSPFLRTLQTVAPYCYAHCKSINLEWSLVESCPPTPYPFARFADLYNRKYRPVLDYTPTGNEEVLAFTQLRKRAHNFLTTLDPQQTHLVVTHLPVINAIVSLYGDSTTKKYAPREYGGLYRLNGDPVRF